VAAWLEDWHAVGQFVVSLASYIVFFFIVNLILCVCYVANKYCWFDLQVPIVQILSSAQQPIFGVYISMTHLEWVKFQEI